MWGQSRKAPASRWAGDLSKDYPNGYGGQPGWVLLIGTAAVIYGLTLQPLSVVLFLALAIIGLTLIRRPCQPALYRSVNAFYKAPYYLGAFVIIMIAVGLYAETHRVWIEANLKDFVPPPPILFKKNAVEALYRVFVWILVDVGLPLFLGLWFLAARHWPYRFHPVYYRDRYYPPQPDVAPNSFRARTLRQTQRHERWATFFIAFLSLGFGLALFYDVFLSRSVTELWHRRFDPTYPFYSLSGYRVFCIKSTIGIYALVSGLFSFAEVFKPGRKAIEELAATFRARDN